jgi:Tol biopolymer transport system component
MEDSMNPLNHTQARGYLQDAADNRLEASQQASLKEHLAACVACRAYEEQIGSLEERLRRQFHKQWDTASSRNINLLPGVRTGYRRKMLKKQLLSYANTAIMIGLVVGLLFLLNWFLAFHQTSQLAGGQTPTPTLATSTPTRIPPTPTASTILTPLPAVTQSITGRPSGILSFVSSREELGDIYFINLDNGGQTRLFGDQQSLSLAPMWSPDGSQLVFVSNRNGNSEIYSLNADGTGMIRLTDDPAEDTDPSWSPDGKQIAFTSDRTGYKEIYVMNADGSHCTQLTFTQAANTHPSWSPDGTSIAFATNRDGYWQIYHMNADGTEQKNLSNNPLSDDREPAWSPDGHSIAFSAKHIYEQGTYIYLMSPDGTNRKRLTDSSSSQQPAANDFSPAWSPDSRWIAFWSRRDNPVYGDIYIIPATGAVDNPGAILSLTTEGGSQPAWKP